MTVITLTTDFTHGDYACGLLFGVIWKLAPEATIIDLSHDIPRHDRVFAAWLLERSMPYFQPGTIHLVVVDPGVGTLRRPIAARLNDQYVVGPDNGIITREFNRCVQAGLPVKVFHLNNSAYWHDRVSSVFHGRDIFAPVAGHLANGVPIEYLGDAVNDPILLPLPYPVVSEMGITGHVVHIDHFGNLSTNIPMHTFLHRSFTIKVGNIILDRFARTFGDANPDELVCVCDSSNHLAICVVNGNAHKRLGLELYAPVDLSFLP